MIPEYLTNTIAEGKVIYKSNSLFSERVKINDQHTAVNILRKIWDNEGTIETCESFVVLALNRANQVMAYNIVGVGGIAGTVADIKLILKFAVDNLASGLIVAHNHPSGNLIPSQADIAITKRLKEAALLLDTQILDHLILTAESHYSFQNEGIVF